jgi:signal peptidase II
LINGSIQIKVSKEMKILYRLFYTIVIVLAVDGISKIWAEHSLKLYQPVSVIGDIFRFTLGYNTGVAFGMFANGGAWPLVITGFIIIGLIGWFVKALYVAQFPGYAAWPIGLLLGGALGNFIDRLPDGRVTDFLDIGIGATRWPTFNLADSFILIGISCLMLLSFRKKAEPDTDSPKFEVSPAEQDLTGF